MNLGLHWSGLSDLKPRSRRRVGEGGERAEVYM